MPPVTPQQPSDNVWISREEYERLKAQPSNPVPPYNPAAMVAQQNAAPVKPSQTQITTGSLIAIALFLSLTVHGLGFFTVPVLIVLLIFAGMSYKDFQRAKLPTIPGQASAAYPVVANNKKNKYHALLIILLIILLTPVIAIIAVFALFFIIVQANGGSAGS